jgi:hypothetical protein
VLARVYRNLLKTLGLRKWKMFLPEQLIFATFFELALQSNMKVQFEFQQQNQRITQ